MAEDKMRIWAKDIQYEFIVHGLSLQVCISITKFCWLDLSFDHSSSKLSFSFSHHNFYLNEVDESGDLWIQTFVW